MLIGALLLVPLPAEVMDRVQVYADALGVEDEVMRVARLVADRCLEVAMIDFERSGYFDHLCDQPAIQELHALKGDTDVWQRVWDEEDLYERWSNLETCRPASLGQGVWRFYMARGFVFPGRPESAPPVLAQHDWIHVLADYGSTIESEIEVFGLIARANHDFRGFSLLAIVLSLFETGHLAEAAGGFFQRDGGHISRDAERMGVRLADAMSRGKRLALHLDTAGRQEESDRLAVDWFKHADRSIDDVRADFGLHPKSARARTAGSVSPWEAGGMSVYQLRLGHERAAASGRDYAAFGASPLV